MKERLDRFLPIVVSFELMMNNGFIDLPPILSEEDDRFINKPLNGYTSFLECTTSSGSGFGACLLLSAPYMTSSSCESWETMRKHSVISAPAMTGIHLANQHHRAVLLLLVCVLLWSTSGVLIKQSSLSALAIVGGRSAIAALVLWAFIRRPRWTWSVPQVGGAVAYLVMVVLFVQATQLTSAANAILLQYTAPIWVALFSFWFLGERLRRSDYIAIVAIFVGMALFFGDALTPAGMLGNGLAVLAGVALAWMTLFMRKQKDGSSLETVLLGNLLAAAVGLPFLITAQVQPMDWAIIGFLGVFQLGLPFLLYAVAIRSLSAIETILISCLEPILNPILVFIVIGETPGPMAMVGGAIVLAAVLMRGLAGWRRRTSVVDSRAVFVSE